MSGTLMVVAPCGDGGSQHFGQEVHVGASGIHGRELHVGTQRDAEGDHLLGQLHHLGAAHAHLVLQVDVGGRDEGVYAGALGVLDGVPALADVVLGAAGQTADDGALDLAGDGLHGGEIAGAAGRETGLDDIDTQADELVGDLQLLGSVHAAAGRLLAVAQGGVEEDHGNAGVAARADGGRAGAGLGCGASRGARDGAHGGGG